MKKKLEIFGLALGWFAVITQLILMMQNREAAVPETLVRFFSFFTILTNAVVALFFTVRAFNLPGNAFGVFYKKGTITALTTFILIVGLIYQVVLRSTWSPTGLQLIVDELLHTVIPAYALFYWVKYAGKDDFRIKPILIWLLYPVLYLAFILIRGAASGFYPYPFVNVPEIGYAQAFVNSSLILVLALIIMLVLVFIGKKLKKASADH